MEYLENLCTGISSTSKNLNERIKNLIPYVPEIQRYFVKQNGKEYYLISVFDKARKAANEDELIYENEIYEAISITENSLYSLIEKRFHEFKKMIKKPPPGVETVQTDFENSTNHKDEILDKAVETIALLEKPEEIYLFHTIVYGENITYYLLIIALNISNERLKEINQSLKRKINDRYDFVLISHDRSWIQKHLYEYQNFFAGIMKSKNRIYSADSYYPELHWENPHNPYHADLEHYYNRLK